jgi:hypothetical protein
MNPRAIFTDYFKALHVVAQQGDAREESLYPALAQMLQAVAQATHRTHIRVTTLPKPTQASS